MENTITNIPITAWAEEDRPREKLLLKGRQSLSDAELIAILLGSGSRSESAVSLAKRMLKSVEYNLDELGKQGIADLKNFKGIGDAKAITIVAALELGRRRQVSDVRQRPSIFSSLDAYNVIGPILIDLPHEEFWAIFLNTSRKVLSKHKMTVGGSRQTIVEPKAVFKKAIENYADAIILVHNHPSGSLMPSQEDRLVTKKMAKAGSFLDIQVLDHLIVSHAGYYSFADEEGWWHPGKEERNKAFHSY